MKSFRLENAKVALRSIATSALVVIACGAFLGVLSLFSGMADAFFLVLVLFLLYISPLFALSSLITFVQLVRRPWPVDYLLVRYKPLKMTFLAMILFLIAQSLIVGFYIAISANRPSDSGRLVPPPSPTAIPYFESR